MSLNHIFPALNEANKVVYAAAIASIGSVLVASLTASAAYFSGKRDRRRKMYGEAYKAVMAWNEMLYRVRRRGGSDAEKQELIKAFHTLQETIDFYCGWMGSESPWMRRSYQRVVKTVKYESRSKIREAWENKPNEPGTEPPKGDPNFDDITTAFLFDVRCHLSWWQLPKLIVVYRNRKWFREDRRDTTTRV